MPITATPHVVKVRHLFDRERASIDENNGMQDVQCWQVETNQISFSPAQAMFAVDPSLKRVPPWYSAHPIFTWLAVTNIQPERVPKNPLAHNVYVTYSAPKFGGQPVGVDKWNIDIKVRGVAYTETLFKTVKNPSRFGGNSIGITNSGRMPYLSGVDETYHNKEIIVNYTTASLDQSVIDNCLDAYNSLPFSLTIGNATFNYDKYTVRLTDFDVGVAVTVSPDGSTSTAFPLVQLVFHHRKPAFIGDRPWDRKIADQGYGVIAAGTNKFTAFLDAAGQPVSTPVLMDGNGAQLTLPGASTPPAPLVPVIYDGSSASPPLGFQTIHEADFTDLLAGIDT